MNCALFNAYEAIEDIHQEAIWYLYCLILFNLEEYMLF
jgi:hypothetical protein